MSGPKFPPTPPAYSPPADWPTLPALGASDQKFVGLFAVYNNGANFVALKATTSSGTYTVDWGDGTTPDVVTSNVQINHQYSYAASGLSSLLAEGYKTAIVTVTPTTANLLTFTLQSKNATAGLNAQTPPWLDVSINGPNLTSVIFGGGVVSLASLQRATVGILGTVLSFANMFAGCRALQSVPLFSTSTGTDFTNMFNGCISIVVIPLFDTSAGITFTSMLSGCSALQSVPLFNTSAGVTFSGMFQLCSALQSVPLFNTSAGVTFTAMFQLCSALQYVPLLNTASGVTFTSMFQTCLALRSVPLLNTASGVTFTSMFNGCTALITLPAFNLAAGTTFTTMLNSCPMLSAAPFAGATKTISFVTLNLSEADLVNTLNGLGTAVTQTVTVTGNFGDDGSAPVLAAITTAQGKGWTVVS